MVTLEQIPFALLLRYFTIDRQHANWLARRRLIRFLYGREMLGEASKMLIRRLLALCYCFARTSHRCAGASFNWVISQFSTSLLTNDRLHCVLLGIRASPCAFVIGTTHHSLCECIVDATGPINFLIARSGQRDNTPRNWIETLVLKYPLAQLFWYFPLPASWWMSSFHLIFPQRLSKWLMMDRRKPILFTPTSSVIAHYQIHLMKACSAIWRHAHTRLRSDSSTQRSSFHHLDLAIIKRCETDKKPLLCRWSGFVACLRWRKIASRKNAVELGRDNFELNQKKRFSSQRHRHKICLPFHIRNINWSFLFSVIHARDALSKNRNVGDRDQVST